MRDETCVARRAGSLQVAGQPAWRVDIVVGWLYLCMHVCVCDRENMYTYIHVFVCLCVSICVYTHRHTCGAARVMTCMHVCMYVWMDG